MNELDPRDKHTLSSFLATTGGKVTAAALGLVVAAGLLIAGMQIGGSQAAKPIASPSAQDTEAKAPEDAKEGLLSV